MTSFAQGDHSQPEPNQQEAKIPETIIIDEADEIPGHQKEIHPKQIAQVPFRIRILCFVIACFTFLWFLGSLLFCLFSWVLATLTLYRNDSFNKMIHKYWTNAKRGAALTTGLVIALFSPQLGFVLIITYFVLQDQAWQQGPMASILRNQFHDYM